MSFLQRYDAFIIVSKRNRGKMSYGETKTPKEALTAFVSTPEKKNTNSTQHTRSHWVAPVRLETVPTEHGSHATVPTRSENVPVGQSTHASAPALGEKLPTAQDSQADRPVEEEKVPRAQRIV